MFWFKKKDIVVDLFTPFETVAEEYPIDYTRKFTPNWFKKGANSYLVDDYIPHPTIKSCAGMLDLWTKGFIVPLWTDCKVNIKENGDYEWQTADGRQTPVAHNSQQWDMFADPSKYGHFKFNDCWSFSTKQNVDWYWTEPYWHQALGLPYTTPPAILNSKYSNVALNIQLMLETDKKRVIDFTAGQPMAQMIPLSDHNIKLKTHVVDHKDWGKYSNEAVGGGIGKFLNGFKTGQKIMKEKEKKCPFHFK